MIKKGRELKEMNQEKYKLENIIQIELKWNTMLGDNLSHGILVVICLKEMSKDFSKNIIKMEKSIRKMILEILKHLIAMVNRQLRIIQVIFKNMIRWEICCLGINQVKLLEQSKKNPNMINMEI